MKILFPIGTLYPSQAGGPSNTIYWLAKALVKQCVEVSLVTTSAGTGGQVATDAWLSTDYGRVIYCSDARNALPLKMMWQTIRLVRSHDCIHLNSLFYPPSLVGAFMALLYRKPVVWSVRGNLEAAALETGQWKKKPVLWLIKRLFTSRNVLFHATSENEVLQTKRVLGKHANVIDIPNYLEMPAPVKRHENNPGYLLFVGRIHPIKALENLLQALHLSSVFNASGWVLKITGAGEPGYVSSLKSLIKNLGLEQQVEFTGHIEGPEKQQLYSDAHFLILPSHSENFGNVIIESMAQGTPVIASTCTPWEILHRKNAGFWVDNESQSLADSLDRALTLTDERYQIMRDNALQLVLATYDIDKNMHHWMSVYADSINFRN